MELVFAVELHADAALAGFTGALVGSVIFGGDIITTTIIEDNFKEALSSLFII